MDKRVDQFAGRITRNNLFSLVDLPGNIIPGFPNRQEVVEKSATIKSDEVGKVKRTFQWVLTEIF